MLYIPIAQMISLSLKKSSILFCHRWFPIFRESITAIHHN